MNRYHLQVGAESSRGRRAENQDRMTRFQCPLGEVIAVADGVGGHQGGSTASTMVVDGLATLLAGASPDVPAEEVLKGAAAQLNQDLLDRGNADSTLQGMGSTLALLLLRKGVHGYEALCAHAGDSRIYLLRQGTLQQLTRDHTFAQQLVAAGALSQEDAAHHPQANVLTRALGGRSFSEVEVSSWFPLAGSDRILLCSDGLSAYAADVTLRDVLIGQREAQNAARHLVEAALTAGSDDNITVQVVRVVDRLGALNAAQARAAARTNPWLIAVAVAAAAAVTLVLLVAARAML